MADQRGQNVRFDLDTEDGCEWGKRKRSDRTAGSLSLPWQKLRRGEGALQRSKRQSFVPDLHFQNISSCDGDGDTTSMDKKSRFDFEGTRRRRAFQEGLERYLREEATTTEVLERAVGMLYGVSGDGGDGTATQILGDTSVKVEGSDNKSNVFDGITAIQSAKNDVMEQLPSGTSAVKEVQEYAESKVEDSEKPEGSENWREGESDLRSGCHGQDEYAKGKVEESDKDSKPEPSTNSRGGEIDLRSRYHGQDEFSPLVPAQADLLRNVTLTCRCECCAPIELVSSLYKFLLGWSLIAVGVVGVVMLFCHLLIAWASAKAMIRWILQGIIFFFAARWRQVCEWISTLGIICATVKRQTIECFKQVFFGVRRVQSPSPTPPLDALGAGTIADTGRNILRGLTVTVKTIFNQICNNTNGALWNLRWVAVTALLILALVLFCKLGLRRKSAERALTPEQQAEERIRDNQIETIVAGHQNRDHGDQNRRLMEWYAASKKRNIKSSTQREIQTHKRTGGESPHICPTYGTAESGVTDIANTPLTGAADKDKPITRPIPGAFPFPASVAGSGEDSRASPRLAPQQKGAENKKSDGGEQQVDGTKRLGPEDSENMEDVTSTKPPTSKGPEKSSYPSDASGDATTPEKMAHLEQSAIVVGPPPWQETPTASPSLRPQIKGKEKATQVSDQQRRPPNTPASEPLPLENEDIQATLPETYQYPSPALNASHGPQSRSLSPPPQNKGEEKATQASDQQPRPPNTPASEPLPLLKNEETHAISPQTHQYPPPALNASHDPQSRSPGGSSTSENDRDKSPPLITPLAPNVRIDESSGNAVDALGKERGGERGEDEIVREIRERERERERERKQERAREKEREMERERELILEYRKEHGKWPPGFRVI